MRTVININKNWKFSKELTAPPQALLPEMEEVDLPHTWNAVDGQDGGNDYFRGIGYYVKELSLQDLPKAEKYVLEFQGANSSAAVYVGGEKLAQHDGGYSTFRVDITEKLTDKTIVTVAVDNAPNEYVYPQMADFTFYGGLYRDVNLYCLPSTHFDLDYFGAKGLMVTPTLMENGGYRIGVKAFTTNLLAGDKIVCEIIDREGNVLTKQSSEKEKIELFLAKPRLWQGRKDPYLYTLRACIVRWEETIDCVSARFGCRSFSIDAEKGFFLNGEHYPLRGVSRHQDRLGVGNALKKEHHDEDMDLICEMGANTIRLAHYQHDGYFYDLCDERGMVVWAEIPYISKHMASGEENTLQQMRELIVQNYNHPSIVVWGLSNEITMGGANDPAVYENHKKLNELVHGMDKTRLTTVACLSMCDDNEPYLQIPDVLSYNHYFGWYGGDVSMTGRWFDNFHKKHPNTPIGCSEYGCEGLNWHTSHPVQGDYTEEYQAYYHEELIKQLFSRPYLWATHVWNMFDFGADARMEGGENGQNHKGLVTFDRKYKKDAFYAYKAWLSEEPFVHICGKRYVERVEEETKITVYSNQPTVALFCNGKEVETQSGDKKFFYFSVPNIGESHLKAVAGVCVDESVIRKVDKMNEGYILKEKGAVLNWFDVTEIGGRYSLNDKISDILSNKKGREWFAALHEKLKKVLQNHEEKGGGFALSDGMMEMMGGFTVLRLTSLLSMMNIIFTKEELLSMNAQLNEIEKTE